MLPATVCFPSHVTVQDVGGYIRLITLYCRFLTSQRLLLSLMAQYFEATNSNR